MACKVQARLQGDYFVTSLEEDIEQVQYDLEVYEQGESEEVKDRLECKEACAVSMHNLGEMNEILGELIKARSNYNQSLSISRTIDFEEGITAAKQGLERLTQKEGENGS